MNRDDRSAGGLLPPIQVQTQPRFQVDGGDVYDVVAGKKIRGSAALCDLLNAMQGELGEQRSLDNEWWTLASGEGVGTPDKKTLDRVQSKIALMRSRFYDRGLRAGIDSAAAVIADWLKSDAAAALFGASSRSMRGLIADEIVRGRWRKR